MGLHDRCGEGVEVDHCIELCKGLLIGRLIGFGECTGSSRRFNLRGLFKSDVVKAWGDDAREATRARLQSDVILLPLVSYVAALRVSRGDPVSKQVNLHRVRSGSARSVNVDQGGRSATWLQSQGLR